MQNGFCESFKGRMRDELLNEILFFGLDHAQAKIADGVGDYNRQRPLSSLAYLTPAAYAAYLTATCDRLRNSDQLCQSQGPHTAAKRRNVRRESNRYLAKLRGQVIYARV